MILGEFERAPFFVKIYYYGRKNFISFALTGMDSISLLP